MEKKKKELKPEEEGSVANVRSSIVGDCSGATATFSFCFFFLFFLLVF